MTSLWEMLEGTNDKALTPSMVRAFSLASSSSSSDCSSPKGEGYESIVEGLVEYVRAACAIDNTTTTTDCEQNIKKEDTTTTTLILGLQAAGVLCHMAQSSILPQTAGTAILALYKLQLPQLQQALSLKRKHSNNNTCRHTATLPYWIVLLDRWPLARMLTDVDLSLWLHATLTIGMTIPPLQDTIIPKIATTITRDWIPQVVTSAVTWSLCRKNNQYHPCTRLLLAVVPRLGKDWTNAFLQTTWPRLVRHKHKDATVATEYRQVLQTILQNLLHAWTLPNYNTPADCILQLWLRQAQAILRNKPLESVVSVAMSHLAFIAHAVATWERPTVIMHDTNTNCQQLLCYCGSHRPDWFTPACEQCGSGWHGPCIGVAEDATTSFTCDYCLLGNVPHDRSTTLLLANLQQLSTDEQAFFQSHWQTSAAETVGQLTEEGRRRVFLCHVAEHSPLITTFKAQVAFLLQWLESPTALWRKWTIKALETIAEGDPKLMQFPVVIKAVTRRLSDDSISVREAAVSLVGLHVVQFPAVANAFHAPLAARLQDVGVSVRKRTVKIFLEILKANPRYRNRASISHKMLQRAVDPKEEDGVRDLIHELFTQLWLSNGKVLLKTPSPQPRHPASPVAAAGLGVVTPGSTASGLQTPPAAVKRSDLAAAQMMEIVKLCGSGQDLEVLLHKLLLLDSHHETSKNSERQKRAALNRKYCECLVDSLFELLIATEESKSKRSRGRDLAAILQTIAVFSHLSTAAVLKHFDTVIPYFKADNAERSEDEAAIVGAVCDIVARLSLNLGEFELEQLAAGSLAHDMVKIIYRFGTTTLSAAVEALSTLAQHPESPANGKFQTKLLDLSRTFYSYMMNKKSIEDFSKVEPKIRSNSHRALTVLGNVCRHMERSTTAASTKSDIQPADLTLDNMIPACYELFLVFLDKKDAPTKCKALRGLAGIFVSQPRLMLELEQSGLIDEVMSDKSHRSIQLEALQSWKDILSVEEKRIDSGHAMEKLENDKEVSLSDRISGDRDGDATLFGGILTGHATRLFQLTQTKDKEIRFASLDLIGQLLRQGLINPNEAVPFLLSLQGDVENDAVRMMALRLLLAEGDQRSDLLRQRICAGVKQAYEFQQKIYPDRDQVSATVEMENGDTECVFSAVFSQGVARNKKQRQGLFNNLLSFFEIMDTDFVSNHRRNSSGKKKKSKLNLSLMSFVVQILGHLPYTAATDPLYIIHQITSLVTLQGGDIVDKLAALLRPIGLAGSDEFDDANQAEDGLEKIAKSKFPSRTNQAAALSQDGFDLERFAELCRRGASLSLLLRLKTHLRKMYNLSDARCLEYDPNAKERIGEKGISKNDSVGMMDADISDSSDTDNLIAQYAEFRRLMREEHSFDEVLKSEPGAGDEQDASSSEGDNMDVE